MMFMMKDTTYMRYIRFFKLLKIAYIQTFFSDTVPQPSVQVCKRNGCFNRKAVPSCNSLTKLGVPKNSAALMGSCSLFKSPNGPAAVGVPQRTAVVHCAARSVHCWGETLQHSVWLQLPKTNGFMPMHMLHCSSPDVHKSPTQSWLSITWPGQISHQLEPAKTINHRRTQQLFLNHTLCRAVEGEQTSKGILQPSSVLTSASLRPNVSYPVPIHKLVCPSTAAITSDKENYLSSACLCAAGIYSVLSATFFTRTTRPQPNTKCSEGVHEMRMHHSAWSEMFVISIAKTISTLRLDWK